MAILGPEYQHDIFFSYAHGDADGDGRSELKQWSQNLAEEVRSSLQKWPDFIDLAFYLDESGRLGERLDATDSAYEGLAASASASAMLLSVMSQWYPDSEWCRQECAWWAEGSEKRAPGVASAFPRAFVCIAQDSPEGQTWPEALTDGSGRRLKGYVAYDRGLPRLQQVPFGTIGDDDDKAAFQRLVIKVAGDLGQKILDMRAALEEERARLHQLDKIGGVADEAAAIFLHAPEDCAKEFAEASESLCNAGYIVAPEEHRPLPRNGRLDDAQEDELRACDGLFILAGDTERSISAELVNIGRNLRKLILAQQNKIMPCGVLDLIGPEGHPDQRIRNAKNLGLEWFDTTSGTWTEDIGSWLRRCCQMASRATP